MSHGCAQRLYDRLGQARANNGGTLSKDEWLRIGDEQFDAEIAAALVERKKLPKAKRKPGERNLLFDALAEACGINLTQITPMMGGSVGRSLADIRAACPTVTPEEIRLRVKTYRSRHPRISFGPDAIGKWWATLGAPVTAGAKDRLDCYIEPKNWRWAAVHLHGEDIGGQVHDRGWFQIDTNMRKDILLVIATSLDKLTPPNETPA